MLMMYLFVLVFILMWMFLLTVCNKDLFVDDDVVLMLELLEEVQFGVLMFVLDGLLVDYCAMWVGLLQVEEVVEGFFVVCGFDLVNMVLFYML